MKCGKTIADPCKHSRKFLARPRNVSCSITAVNDKKDDSKMYNELPLKEFWKPNLNFVKSKEFGATLKTIWLHLVSPRKSTRSPLKMSASVTYGKPYLLAIY